VMVQQSTCKV